MAFELPEGDPCFFCEVIAGRIDKGLIEETDKTLTLVNGRQFETGQVIVISRRHAPTLLDLTQEEATAVMQAVQRVSKAIVGAFSPDGLFLYQNNGVASGQEIPHFHMHVVPRRKSGSNWGNGPPHIAELEGLEFRRPRRPVIVSVEEERQVAEKIRHYYRSHAEGE